MVITERDYFELTNQELKDWEKIKSEQIEEVNNFKIYKSTYFYKCSKAVRHYLSLFPNNYLDIVDLKDISKLSTLRDNFKSLLDDSKTIERSILKFINENKAYFIIASILKENYKFGHHDAYIFPEFKLGTTHTVDYLIIGSGSGGYELVFVELENVYGRITQQNGDFGENFRKGISQISDWDKWIESNYSSMSEILIKFKSKNTSLNEEFYKLDKTRIHYVLVSGRRTDFNEKTYRIQRKELQNNLLILHYDNLLDFSEKVIGASTY